STILISTLSLHDALPILCFLYSCNIIADHFTGHWLVLFEEKNILMSGLFNVRVYGILIGENRQVLVSDEYIRGGYYTKFPGGGLDRKSTRLNSSHRTISY